MMLFFSSCRFVSLDASASAEITSKLWGKLCLGRDCSYQQESDSRYWKDSCVGVGISS